MYVYMYVPGSVLKVLVRKSGSISRKNRGEMKALKWGENCLKAKAFHRLCWCISVFVFLSGEREPHCGIGDSGGDGWVLRFKG